MTTATAEKIGLGEIGEYVAPAIAAILGISAAASAFLFWLIYVHPAAASSTQYAFLPALNAVLNGLSATALLVGYTFIRAKRIAAHRAAIDYGVLFFDSVSGELHCASRASWGCAVSIACGIPGAVSLAARKPHHAGC